MNYANLPALTAQDPFLTRWGRRLDTDFLIEAGPQAWLIVIRDGRVFSVRAGPFVMPSWTFALRADAEPWATFLQPNPPPGYHDLFALVRRGALRLEGDLRPFMSHILWFKRMFEMLREQGR